MTAIATEFFQNGLLTGSDAGELRWGVRRMRVLPRIPSGRRSDRSAAPDAALTPEACAEPPCWAEPVVAAIATLLDLQENWDSYGARRVNPAEAAGAFELLLRILDDDSPIPRIGPTVRGGVIMEWHRNGIDLEIETLSPWRFSAAFEELSGATWEREIVSNHRPVVEVLRRLT